MILCFTLTMPKNNSWNGRWSGDEKLYAVVKNMGRTKKAVEKSEGIKGDHSYFFGDGWVANINVKEVGAEQARKIRKNSLGFCGYEWMVRSILAHGEIKI